VVVSTKQEIAERREKENKTPEPGNNGLRQKLRR
jgi:hypothetical protein